MSGLYQRNGIYYYIASINGKTVRKSTKQRTLKAAQKHLEEIEAAIQRNNARHDALKLTAPQEPSSWAEWVNTELAKPNAGLVGIICRRAKSRALEMKREFMLDYNALGLAMLACKGRCAVTGMPLSLNGKSYERPSIDRIDSSKGYTMDNIRITSVIANISMNNWGEQALREMCAHFAMKLFTGQ